MKYRFLLHVKSGFPNYIVSIFFVCLQLLLISNSFLLLRELDCVVKIYHHVFLEEAKKLHVKRLHVFLQFNDFKCFTVGNELDCVV